MRRLFLFAVALAACGCGAASNGGVPPGVQSDERQVRAADYSVLFVGNSHTSWHDLPGVVAGMIRHRHPGKTVYTHVVGVGFLEDLAVNPTGRREIDTRPWKHVVLQAQKISTSGRHDYSRAEGIEFAAAAKARGADVVFYSEWGLRGVAGDGPKQEAVYRQMAEASGGRVAAVGRAWDFALAEKPSLPLYADDGNHQTALGAYLTAAVLYAAVTGDNPTTLADFPYPEGDAATRQLLLTAAAKAVE